MDTYNTLEEIKAGFKSSLFDEDNKWELRPEQREAIDLAKERFCKRSGTKGNYVWTVQPKFKQFLWNAKMRFGKTICALQLAREMGVKRTLIVTHRPVVNKSWKDDFDNVFGDKILGNTNVKDKYAYGTLFDDNQHDKKMFYSLQNFAKTDGNHFVFFVSMQYLRLSELVNAKTQLKNKDKQQTDQDTKENEKLKADILNADWDLVVVDEAHEGTRTALGKRVIDEYLGHKEKDVKVLHLSGTPFNLYEDFAEDEIYTWDYVSEQQAKRNWAVAHPQEDNPYAELPQMKIFTYDITKNIDAIVDQTGVFSFSEFFRVWTGNPKADRATMPHGAKGRFVHEEDVLKLLKLLCTKDAENNFPFSTDEYRKMFRHTLWVVSHVDEAKALEQLLKEHSIFKRFNVINVAGNNPDDETYDDALDKVHSAIGALPEKTSTITISCGRLTTGVTVKPWSAVLYLKGGDGAATYMQTIFRVQSPYTTPDGRMKTSCYVFDFAPDRTLKIVAETAKFSSMAKAKEAKKKENEDDLTQEQRDKQMVSDFIELCPVISMDGGKMSELDVNTIYKKLENVFVDRLVRKGFDDPCLYVQEELNKIDKDIINNIGENGGQAPDETRKDAGQVVDLSHMTPEEREKWEENIRKKKAEAAKKAADKAKKDEAFRKQWESWTDEQREEWLQQEAEKAAKRELAKQQREEFKKRVSNIRGIALRIPLLMYGGADAGDTKEDITVDNFTRKIKDESWAEFMPKGISKEDFNKIRKCFNATRFEEAGKKYRALTREADFMHVNDRIKRITEIFASFHNPDKETVLSPWRVVNMHLSDTIGGYCFFDETFDKKNGVLDTPRFIDQGNVTRDIFDNVDLSGEIQTKILEINSKTGLYPLYVTYSLYRRRLEEYIKAECIDGETVSVQEEQVVWDDIVTDNIFIICNTHMAMGITRRTLFGYREVEKKANIKAETLIEKASTDPDNLVKKLRSFGYWKGTNSKEMIEFSAIVANPPYQISDGGNASTFTPVYNRFVDLARKINPSYISMIIPAKWYIGGKEPESFRPSIQQDNSFQKIFDFENFRWVFPDADIAGGVCYFLWNKHYSGLCEFTNKNNVENTSTVLRSLNDYKVVVRQNKAVEIVEYLKKKNINNGKTLTSVVSVNKPFGLRTYYKPESDGIPCWFAQKIGLKYAKPEDITDPYLLRDKWKLLIPAAPIAGQTDFSKPVGFYYDGNVVIAQPGEICTETFVVAFSSDYYDEVESFKSYLFTKIVRFLLLQCVISQHVTKENFLFVPDLGKYSGLYTDERLCKEWGITEDQWQYIDSRIKSVTEMNIHRKSKNE